MSKYGQPIVFFFCRPCADYHHKTHPHYRAMKRRKAKRRKLVEAKAAVNPVASPKIALFWHSGRGRSGHATRESPWRACSARPGTH